MFNACSIDSECLLGVSFGQALGGACVAPHVSHARAPSLRSHTFQSRTATRSPEAQHMLPPPMVPTGGVIPCGEGNAQQLW